MAERFTDYFRELSCLDRAKSREDNYEKLKERYQRVKNQAGQRAIREQSLLTEAMEIFTDKHRYQEYLRQWDAEVGMRDSEQRAEIDEAHRRAEEARKRAQAAEAARQREAKKREELEKKLAERQSQLQPEEESSVENQRPGFLESLLKVGAQVLADRLLKGGESTGRPPQAREPTPINLSGDWRSADGILHRIWQRGNQIKIQAMNPLGVVIMDGAGTFDGYNIHVSYTALVPTVLGPKPTSGEAQAEVSSNGQNIWGRATNYTTGQIININLYR